MAAKESISHQKYPSSSLQISLHSKTFGLPLQSYEVWSLLEAEKKSDHCNYSGLDASWNSVSCTGNDSVATTCRAVLREWCKEYASACLTFYSFWWKKLFQEGDKTQAWSCPDCVCQHPTELRSTVSKLGSSLHRYHVLSFTKASRKGFWWTFLWRKQDSGFKTLLTHSKSLVKMGLVTGNFNTLFL